MENNLKYWLWLSLCPNLQGDYKLSLLQDFNYNPNHIFLADEQILHKFQFPPNILTYLLTKNLDEVNRILGRCDQLGLHHITFQDTIYPQSLRTLANPPLVLYAKGKMPRIEDQPTIAMVGARKASNYGTGMASRFAYELTYRKALIVTGMAEGVDSFALGGALKAGGPVISIVAGGIDKVYPQQSYHFYQDVPAVGVLLSEYPPGTPHKAAHFSYRNRILSGISSGVFIIESKVTGGTMLTAKHAIDQGKDIFILPGHIDIPTMSGNFHLMQTHQCYPVSKTEDILEYYKKKYPLQQPSHALLMKEQARLNDLKEIVPVPPKNTSKKKTPLYEPKTPISPKAPEPETRTINPDDFSQEEITILRVLGTETLSQDAIIIKTDLPSQTVLMSLITLESMDAISCVSSRHYKAIVTLPPLDPETLSEESTPPNLEDSITNDSENTDEKENIEPNETELD